jgi:hypothetical protein
MWLTEGGGIMDISRVANQIDCPTRSESGVLG